MVVPIASCILAELFLQQVAHRPEEIALKIDGEEKIVTFSELHARVVAIKKTLAERGTRHRPVVAVACTSQVAELCAVLAVVLIGGCFVPIDDKLPASRRAEVMKDAQPNAIVLSMEGGEAQYQPGADPRSENAKEVTGSVLSVLSNCHVVEVDNHGRVKERAQSSENGDEADCKRSSHNTPPSERGTTATPVDTARDAATTAVAQMCADTAGANSEASLRPVAKEGSIGELGERGELDVKQRLVHETIHPGFLGDGNGTESARVASCEEEDDLLYILYTSGSTAKPKGVRGTRSGALNRIRFGWNAFPFHPAGELVCRRTPSCFVDFVAEVFSPLLAGIPLFLPGADAVADPLRLVPILSEARVSRITLTPSLLSSLLRTAETLPMPLLPHLHTWFVSGEALHADLAVRFRQQAAPGAQLVNLYGSTEVAGDATYCTLDDILPHEPQPSGCRNAANTVETGVLIGRPLPNVYTSVVDPALHPVPLGQAGELLVGGVGVALGYHNRPTEMAHKFLRSVDASAGRGVEGGLHIPGMPAGRIVRTGDRVRQSFVNGPFFWLGRLDSEVQVRGVRVSLEVVEMVVCRATKLPADAFAAVWDPGLPDVLHNEETSASKHGLGTTSVSSHPDRGHLLGCFVEEELPDDYKSLHRLKRRLARELSVAQCPTQVVLVKERLPLTVTGKVDKAALLADYRTRQPRKFEGCPAASLGRKFDTDSPTMLAKLETNSSLNSLALRLSIARAINSVVPDSLSKTSEWIARSPPAGTHAPEAPTHSDLSFTDLGGTSLMAVEAAWLTSRFLAEENKNTSSGSLLEASDFLGGTLDDVVLLARNNARKKSSPPALGLEATFEPSHVGARRADSKTWAASPQLPVLPPRGLSIASSPAVGRAGRESSRGVKRHLEEPESRSVDGVEVRETPQFMAVGKAGIGTLHSAECLGASATLHATKDAAVVEHVAFRRRWSRCLTKCVDATPLVIIPTDNASRLLAGDPAERTSTSVEGFTSRTCCCLLQLRKSATRGGSRLLVEGGSGRAIENVPVVPTHGMVYIGSHAGKFCSLSLDSGESQWALTVGGRIESGACCSSDGSLVYVGCHDRCLRAVCRRTGTVRWSHETGEVIKCTPVSVSADDQGPPGPGCCPETAEMRVSSPGVGAVLVGSHDGLLRCLRQVDGQLLWSFDCGGALFASPAHDSKARVVYAATTKGRLLAIARSPASKDRDSITGADLLHCAAEHNPGRCIAGRPFILWEQHLPAPCFSSPTVCASTGALVLGCVNGKMYCFSANGDRLWVCADGKKPIFSSPCLLPTLPGEGEDAGKGPDLVWGCHDGNIRRRRCGRVIWATDVGQGHPVFSSPFCSSVPCADCSAALQLVFSCSVPGSVVVLRLCDGIIVGDTRIPGEVFSSPVVVGCKLVVGCRDNRVYCLDILAHCSRCKNS